MIPALTAKEMAEVDKLAVEEFDLPIPMMMEKAGKNTALLVKKLLKNIKGKKIVVLVGPGNNGGDGLVAALYLKKFGAEVSCVLAVKEEKLHDVSKFQYNRCLENHIEVMFYVEKKVSGKIKNSDLILDCLLGYNIRGKPRRNVAVLINKANASKALIVAMDTPTGLDTTTGKTVGVFVKADYTATLALPKTGLYKVDVGKLYLVDIGIPGRLYKKIGKKVGDVFKEKPFIRI